MPNTTLRTVLRALGIYPGEGLATALLFGQCICLGVTLFTLYTASTALFLSHFDANALPYVFVVAAILLILSGLFFNRLQRTIPFDRLLLGVMGALTLLLLLLRLGFWLGAVGWMAFLIMVAFRLCWTLANLVTWTLAGRLFNLRQSKRLFPLIMAGSVVGIIATSLVNEQLIAWLGAPNLLLVAVGSMLGTMLLLFITMRRFRENLGPAETDSRAGPSRPWSQIVATYRNRYLLWLFGFSMISTIATYLLDYIFVSAAGARYQTTEEYATFFGTYLSITTVGLLIVSVAGGIFLTRFGLRWGLLANSLVVTALAALLLLSQLAFGSWASLFWLVVLTKLSDDLLAATINSASIRILLQPIPAAQRVAAQTALESIAVPISMGIVGLLLILVQSVGALTPQQSTLLLVGLSLVWLYASIKVFYAYRLALRNALQKRHIDTVDIDLNGIEQDQVRDQVLYDGLQSEHPGVVLYSLNLITAFAPQRLTAQLPHLLTHPALEVRLDLVQRLEQIGRTNATPQLLPLLQQRLEDEPTAPVRGAICRALLALGDEQIRAASAFYLTHADREIRTATLVGLLRAGGIQDILAAGPALLALVHSGSEEERILGAQLVGQVADPKFFEPLLPLLTDEKPAVRNAAIDAAGLVNGLVNNNRLWPLVVQAIVEPATRKRALNTVRKGGEAALPALAGCFAEPGQSQEVQIALAQVVGQISGPNAGALLWRWAIQEDRGQTNHARLAKELCGALWHGLARSGFTGTAATRANMNVNVNMKVNEWIEQTLADTAWLAAARQSAIDGDGEPLLVAALTVEIVQNRATLFDLLTLLGDGALIKQVRQILERPVATSSANRAMVDNEQRAFAQEVLDDLLDLLAPTNKTVLLPLLTEALDQTNLSAIQQQYPTPTQEYAHWLQTLGTASAAQLTPWTKACAFYAAGNTTQPTDRRIAMMLSTMEKVFHLKAVPIFAQIPDQMLANIATRLEAVDYARDQPIFQKGDPGDALYIVVAGRVRITDDGLDLEQVGEGGVFGELALLDDEPRSASATVTEETLLLRLPQAAFHELLAEESAIARGILRVLSLRLRARTQDLRALHGAT